MAWAILGGAAVVAGTQLYSAKRAKTAQKDAQRKAEKDALEAEKRARKAEVFAETEGEGIGDLGTISLELDDELDEDKELSGKVSI